jgi:hypothetical protein
MTYMLFLSSRAFYMGKLYIMAKPNSDDFVFVNILLGNVNYAHPLDRVCGCLFCLTHVILPKAYGEQIPLEFRSIFSDTDGHAQPLCTALSITMTHYGLCCTRTVRNWPLLKAPLHVDLSHMLLWE